jgi:tRNA(fMet)-specific endonuclease VapC
MLLLDTNHLKELAYPTALGERLRGRLLQSGAQVFTTVITLEEELRGVLARTNRALDSDERILAYQKLIERVNFFARWVVLSMDAESTAYFAHLRSQGVRIGTMDLRIASIALAHDATLLTRNTVDFAQVPGLRFENWLD